MEEKSQSLDILRFEINENLHQLMQEFIKDVENTIDDIEIHIDKKNENIELILVMYSEGLEITITISTEIIIFVSPLFNDLGEKIDDEYGEYSIICEGVDIDLSFVGNYPISYDNGFVTFHCEEYKDIPHKIVNDKWNITYKYSYDSKYVKLYEGIKLICNEKVLYG